MSLSIKISIPFFFFITLSYAQIDFAIAKDNEHTLLKAMDKKIIKGDFEMITSVLIAQDGKLIYERYYNENNINSLHNTRSATKSIATLLTGIAKDKGLISEKNKIFDYLQHKKRVQNPDSRKARIMLEDLLTMSCILETDDSNIFSRGHEERMYLIEDWTQFLIDLPIRSYSFGPKPSEQPYGKHFSYSSAQAAAVSEILQVAVGQKLDSFLIKELFTPLEIQEYKLDYTPLGFLNTAGGSQYKSRDFLKLMQLCLNRGNWKGEQLISQDWISKATSPKAKVREGVDYGYLFWIQSFGKTNEFSSFYMAGNGGNRMLAFPDLKATVVVTTINYNNQNAHDYVDKLLNEFIVPVLSNSGD
ncbi:MAG: serine hydrolase [Croceitalea sp.]|nr:beta-lactamase family protein [Croceitalea sp.]NNL09473.1 serine hydrolase [Croceitalea sp.]